MLTVQEAHAKWDGWIETRRSTGTAAKYRQLLRPFVEEYSDRDIGSLTAAELELDYLGRYARLSAATQRNHFAALKSLFDLAERFDWLLRNPMRRIEAPTRNDRFKGFLTDEEDQAVQDSCVTGQEATLVTLLRYSGLRISEAVNLRWEDVDLEGGRWIPQPALIVQESKTPNGRRTIPLVPTLVRQLRIWKQKQTGPYVIGSKKGTKPMLPQLAHRLIARVGLRAAGCFVEPHPALEKLSPHALRRQYASVALNRGADLHTVSRALGHASTAITEKAYARLSDDRVAARMMEVA